MRGSIPRKLLKAVATATYHQVWWPPHDRMTYRPDRPPVWDDITGGYVDPKTGAALPTWDEAIAQLEVGPDAEPAYVARMGSIDPREIRGVEAGTRDAERCIRYVVWQGRPG